jgi:DNA-binding CsgD family transcriptional regulator
MCNCQNPTLTPRECEVCRFLAQGYSAQEIATTLAISLLTARKHIDNVREKLSGRAVTTVRLAIMLSTT